MRTDSLSPKATHTSLSHCWCLLSPPAEAKGGRPHTVPRPRFVSQPARCMAALTLPPPPKRLGPFPRTPPRGASYFFLRHPFPLNNVISDVFTPELSSTLRKKYAHHTTGQTTRRSSSIARFYLQPQRSRQRENSIGSVFALSQSSFTILSYHQKPQPQILGRIFLVSLSRKASTPGVDLTFIYCAR